MQQYEEEYAALMWDDAKIQPWWFGLLALIYPHPPAKHVIPEEGMGRAEAKAWMGLMGWMAVSAGVGIGAFLACSFLPRAEKHFALHSKTAVVSKILPLQSSCGDGDIVG